MLGKATRQAATAGRYPHYGIIVRGLPLQKDHVLRDINQFARLQRCKLSDKASLPRSRAGIPAHGAGAASGANDVLSGINARWAA